MAQQMIRGGAPIDIPTADENAVAVDGRMRAFYAEQREIEGARERARLRAKKRMEMTVPVSPAAATAFQLGPDEGYIWSVRLVGVIMTSNNLAIYKASASGDTRRPVAWIGSASAVQVATWSSDQFRLRHGEGVYIVPQGGTLTGFWVSAWQVPAEMEGEVYD